jgi:hypothetical protein
LAPDDVDGGGDDEDDRAATPPSESVTTLTPDNVGQDIDDSRPPDVVIHASDRAMAVSAHSFCYGDVCADGTVPPPSGPPDVGAAPELFVEFPIKSWSFEARIVEAGTDHGREQTVLLEPQPDGRWRLGPAGVGGVYDIWLWGRGTGGDAGYVFRWTSTEDGSYTPPAAYAGVLANHDGRVDSYGVELSITGLAQTPATATAQITVTSSNGDGLTIDTTRSNNTGPEGSVRFDGPHQEGLAAARLGPPPFTYDVILTLDGVRYEATATWPQDQIVGSAPYVALQFDPPLPGLG